MGISWGLETRVMELFVIECLSCSLLSPPKRKKEVFQKVKIKKFQTQEKKPRRKQIIKNRKKHDTKTKHPQIITYKKTKESLVLEILSRSLFK